ncbi:MAG: patatin family protein [Firmicutes bacterium]|nr:patatin family protein [Bacillota bacterium]MBR3392861.1 patatin family protein [Bacillota bacterium]
MIGIIDVGGGQRDIYGAGVLDYCMKFGIRFDYCIGVSAGSANLASYLSGQSSRNFRFYTDYSFRKEYMGIAQFLSTGNYINLDYVYSTLANSDSEDPLDYAAIKNSSQELVVVATDARTGKPVYFTRDDMAQDQYDIFKASSCVPGFNKPYPIGDGLYYDGGISDPIPIEKAFDAGCEKVVVILTRPLSYQRDPKNDRKIVRRIRSKYPQAAEALENRAATYNRQLDLCKQYAEEGKVLIVAPDDIGKLKTLTRDLEALKHLYHKGQDDAAAIIGFLGIKLSTFDPGMMRYPY